jgi:hypothetical protein
MTTFTTEDRIIAERDGSLTINVEGGTVSSPPHIVDSGASVMIKDLTDDEILDIWEPFDLSGDAWVYDEMLIGFARAILRKAQEK